MNFVQTYLPLQTAEQTEYEKLLSKIKVKEVKTMQLTWAEQMERTLTKKLRKTLRPEIKNEVRDEVKNEV